MKITSPPITYPPVGQCIYCGSTKEPLGKEHIIPYGLGGNLVLPKASCKGCEAITGGFEQVCLRTMFGPARLRLNMPTRRRKERPKKRSEEHTSESSH